MPGPFIGSKRTLLKRSTPSGLVPDLGKGYAALVGNPPDPRTLAWFSWYSGLLAQRLVNVPNARTTTYYVDPEWIGGDGSEAAPFSTLAQAMALIGSNVRIRLKRDGIFEYSGSLSLPSNTTLDDYGSPSSKKPIVTWFTDAPNSGWSNVAGTTYSISSASQVDWVKTGPAGGGEDRPLHRVASSATCQSTTDSFYYGSGTVYVNLGETWTDGSPPVPLQFVTGNDTHVDLSGDNIRVENIRFEGVSIRPASSSTPLLGMRLLPSSATAELVVVGCDVYFTGYHAFSQLDAGICTFKDCKSGCLVALTGGATNYVSYAATGGQETIFDNCESTSGVMRDGGVLRSSTPIYAHTTGDGNGRASLIIARGCTTLTGVQSCTATSSFVNLPTAATLSDVRGFIVEDVQDYGEDYVLSAWLPPTNMAIINSFWRGLAVVGGSNSLGAAGAGWAINCVCVGAQSGGYGSLLDPVDGDGTWLNCELRYSAFGVTFGIVQDAAGWDDLEMRDCIITRLVPLAPTEPDQYLVNVANNATGAASRSGTAFIGCLDPQPAAGSGFFAGRLANGAGCGAFVDVGKVNIAYTSAPALLAVPSSGSPLYNAGAGDGSVEYDYYRTARGSRKTIGPVNGA